MDRGAVESPGVHQLEASHVSDTTRLLSIDALDTQDKRSEATNDSRWERHEASKVLPWWQRPSVYWLLFPFTVFTLAFGGIPEVQKNAATFMLVMNLITGLLSAIVTPKVGHISARYGRTRLMALASCGGLVAEFITILVARFPQVIDYRWLILGSVFNELTSSFTAGSILHQSYISDCTPPSKRAASTSYMHTCLFTGLAFGPLLAGYFVKWTGSLLSIFYVVLGCHNMFVIVIRFIEKWDKEQGLRAETRRSVLSTIQTANPFEPLKMLSTIGPRTSTALRRYLIALALNDIIIFGISQAAGAVIILYSEHMYGWSNFESSRFVSVLSLVRYLIMPAENHYGADNLDIWVLRPALMSDILVFFFHSGMVTAMGGLGSATIQAIVTRHVPSNRVGQLLGAISQIGESPRSPKNCTNP
ncbi:major facilitator superfamily domain-containing protein [Fusarium sp. MPI-SDFR-AT-0072]|nr:major facilitator superfamily domain-containing protein [Fusarium sp. MPI-SDFR-AT-0072]